MVFGVPVTLHRGTADAGMDGGVVGTHIIPEHGVKLYQGSDAGRINGV